MTHRDCAGDPPGRREAAGDAGQRVCEPGLGIDAAEFCRFDQRIGDGC